MKKKRLLCLLACLLLTLPVLTLAESSDEKLAAIMDEVVALTTEERAEFVAGLIVYMSLTGEGDLIQGAIEGMISGTEWEVKSNVEPTSADEKGSADSISSEVGTRQNPVPFGDTIELPVNIGVDKGVVRITVMEVWRGAEAVEMVGNSIGYRPALDESHEYLVFKVKEEIVSTENDAKLQIHSAYFHAVSNDGVVYGDSACPINGYQSVPEMFAGTSVEAYMAIAVEKDDRPLLSVLENYTEDRKPVYFALQ